MKNKKQIIIFIFLILILATAIYSEEDICKDKTNCLNKETNVNQKIDRLQSLNVGGIGYRDLEEYSVDIPSSIDALYQEAILYKTLAQLRSQYEGISQTELVKEEVEISSKKIAPTSSEINGESGESKDTEEEIIEGAGSLVVSGTQICNANEDKLLSSESDASMHFLDGLKIFIPAQATCGGSYSVIIQLHGVTDSNNQLNTFLNQGFVDMGNIVTQNIASGGEPVIIVEPVDLKSKSTTLWSSEFDYNQLLLIISSKLQENNIQIRDVSVIAHSGAGCDLNNGIYKVINIDKNLRVVGLEDTCYRDVYAQKIISSLSPNTKLISVHTATVWNPSTSRDFASFDNALGLQTVTCPSPVYSSCKQSSNGQYLSYTTRSASHYEVPKIVLQQILSSQFSTIGPTPEDEEAESLIGKECGELLGPIEEGYSCMYGTKVYWEETRNYECLGPCYTQEGKGSPSTACCKPPELETEAVLEEDTDFDPTEGPPDTDTTSEFESSDINSFNLESYDIVIRDGSFSRNYIAQFKEGGWYWCKVKIFSNTCDEKEKKEISKNKPSDASYNLIYYLENKDYDEGIESIFSVWFNENINKEKSISLLINGKEIEMDKEVIDSSLALAIIKIEDEESIKIRVTKEADHYVFWKSEEEIKYDQAVSMIRDLATKTEEEGPLPSSESANPCPDGFESVPQYGSIKCNRKVCCVTSELLPKLEDLRVVLDKYNKGVTIISAKRSAASQRDVFYSFLGGGNEACPPRGVGNKKTLAQTVPDASKGSSKEERIKVAKEWLTQNMPEKLRIIEDLSRYTGCNHVLGYALDIYPTGYLNPKTTPPEIKQNLRNMLCEAGWANYGGEWWHYEFNTPSYEQAKLANKCSWGAERFANARATVTPNYA